MGDVFIEGGKNIKGKEKEKKKREEKKRERKGEERERGMGKGNQRVLPHLVSVPMVETRQTKK